MQSSKKTKNNKNEIDLTTIALAFFPITGIVGVHDIAIKRYKEGIIHICIGVFAYILLLFIIINPVKNSSLVNIINGVVIISLIASYVWAIIEGIQMLYIRNQDKIATNEETPAPIDSTVTYQSTQDEKAKSTIYNIKAYSIISFILAIIPVLLWLYYLIAQGSIDRNQIGSKEFAEVDLLLPAYYWTVGILFSIVSIGFGIAGLKTKLKTLAIISLFIKAVTMITAAFIVF